VLIPRNPVSVSYTAMAGSTFREARNRESVCVDVLQCSLLNVFHFIDLFSSCTRVASVDKFRPLLEKLRRVTPPDISGTISFYRHEPWT